MSDERDLTEFEALLRKATPASSTLDRDRLLFLAGAASIERRQASKPRWIASIAVAAAMLVCAAGGWALGVRSASTLPQDEARHRLTAANVSAPAPLSSSFPPTPTPTIATNAAARQAVDPPPPPFLLAARQQALNHGIESWETAPASFTPPVSSPLTSGAASIDESSPTY